jgi:arylsulfatase A-like enzyme
MRHKEAWIVNVILVLIDTLRRDYLSVYGNTWVKTPAFSHFAQDSVVFDNAYIGSYPCMPARRDLWTGKLEFPWRGWGPLEDNEETLPRILTRHGITTMLISDHYHLWEHGSGNYHMDFSGFHFIRGQENDRWITDPAIPIDYPAPPNRLCQHMMDVESGNDQPGAFERYRRNTFGRRSERDYFPAQVMETAMQWLEGNRTASPFFLLIDCFDPHEPFDPPYPFNTMYDPDYEGPRFIWPSYGQASQYDARELENIRALYAGELSFVDKWFGRLVEKVEELGLARDTAIICVTDHGHLFGEHNLIGKPWLGLADSNLYQELAHIPLMIRDPEQPGGRRDHRLVQMIDLFPTVLDFFNLPIPTDLHGRSLRANTAESPSAVIFGKFGEALNITDGRWVAFIPPKPEVSPIWFSGRYPHRVRVQGTCPGGYVIDLFTQDRLFPALFDLQTDPGQQNNLYSSCSDQWLQMKRLAKQRLLDYQAPTYLVDRYDL